MANPLAATPPPATTYGEDDVQRRVKNIASQDSALNQMARTEAAKVMNSRGMLNSSMYAGAAQDAVLRQAVPIASQESNQAFQSYESGLQRASTEGMQAKDIASQQLMQGKDITSREGMQGKDIASQQYMQARDVGSREWMQQKDINNQQTIQSWNLKSSDRSSAAQFLTNMETQYASAYQSIMANPNLNAEQRTAQLNAAKQMNDRQRNFVEQLFGVDLVW